MIAVEYRLWLIFQNYKKKTNEIENISSPNKYPTYYLTFVTKLALF